MLTDEQIEAAKVVNSRFVYATPEQISNLRKWIRTLRSGKYKQGKHQLITELPPHEKLYCCLGVAACLFDESMFKRNKSRHVDRIAALFGMNASIESDDAYFLTAMNDYDKATFEEIADVLEDYTNLLEYANKYEHLSQAEWPPAEVE